MASHYYQQAIPPVKDRLRYAGHNLDEIDLCEMENRLLQDEISIHILNLPDHQQSPPPHEIPPEQPPPPFILLDLSRNVDLFSLSSPQIDRLLLLQHQL